MTPPYASNAHHLFMAPKSSSWLAQGGAAGCQPYLPDRERGFTGIAHADLRAEERSVVARSIGVDPGNGTAEGAGIVRHSPAAVFAVYIARILEFDIARRSKIEGSRQSLHPSRCGRAATG